MPRTLPVTVLSVLLGIAFVFQLIACLTVPVTSLSLCEYKGYKFGVFGVCHVETNVCTPVHIGYRGTDFSGGQVAFTLPSNSRFEISRLLIVHPISCGFIGVNWVFMVLLHFYKVANCTQMLLVILLWSILTFMLTLLSFLVDVLLFIPNLSWTGWMLLASSVLIAISAAFTCLLNRALSSRRENGDEYDHLMKQGDKYHEDTLTENQNEVTFIQDDFGTQQFDATTDLGSVRGKASKNQVSYELVDLSREVGPSNHALLKKPKPVYHEIDGPTYHKIVYHEADPMLHEDLLGPGNFVYRETGSAYTQERQPLEAELYGKKSEPVLEESEPAFYTEPMLHQSQPLSYASEPLFHNETAAGQSQPVYLATQNTLMHQDSNYVDPQVQSLKVAPYPIDDDGFDVNTSQAPLITSDPSMNVHPSEGVSSQQAQHKPVMIQQPQPMHMERLPIMSNTKAMASVSDVINLYSMDSPSMESLGLTKPSTAISQSNFAQSEGSFTTAAETTTGTAAATAQTFETIQATPAHPDSSTEPSVFDPSITASSFQYSTNEASTKRKSFAEIPEESQFVEFPIPDDNFSDISSLNSLTFKALKNTASRAPSLTSSHLTSVSQRGINPMYLESQPQDGPRTHNMTFPVPLAQSRSVVRTDVLLDSNPDFMINPRSPKKRPF